MKETNKNEDQTEASELTSSSSTISWRAVKGKALRWGIPALALLGLAYFFFLRPVKVIAHRVVQSEIVHEIYGRGTIESQREVQLGFDMVGRISDLLVDQGDKVTLGQEMARLYTDTVDAEVKTARSSVSVAQATLGRLASEERKARQSLRFAKSEEVRIRNLLASHNVAAAELDAASQATRLARSDLDRVLGLRREATRGVDVASGGVESRQASALRATLLAPFDGVIVRTFREPGDTVSVGSTVVRIVDTHDLIVRAWIDESALVLLKEGQPVRILLGGHTKNYTGVLSSIGQEVDRQTHELLVEATMSDIPPNLVVGQRAELFVEVERKSEAVSLPLSFLMRDTKGLHTFIDAEGKTKRVPLQLGISGRKNIEVISGLSAGDKILRAGKANKSLKAGRRFVEIQP